MNWRDHIEANEEILRGKPVLIGTRISVEHVIQLLASGWNEQQILDNYPRLTKIHLQAVFQYIQECMKDGLMYHEPLKSV
ncbi:MAG: DUF433 domain-containing protein [Bacteroidales bacterium]|nr:DUF433 domain-containing protein [Bacteroidales bacterium]